MGRQGLKRFAPTFAAKEKPQEAHFHNHWHPEQAWVVHEPKGIDHDLNDQENDPKDDQGQAAQGKCFPQVGPVSIVIFQNCGDHCDKRNAHDTHNVDLEAESETRKVIFYDEPLETEKKDALYHQFTKCLAHDL